MMQPNHDTNMQHRVLQLPPLYFDVSRLTASTHTTAIGDTTLQPLNGTARSDCSLQVHPASNVKAWHNLSDL